jgi:hypothetical protein
MIRAERAGKPLFVPTVAKDQGIVA